MWPYPWTHVRTPSHLGHMDPVAATMPSQAHAGAAQEAPDIGQWEGQDVPLVRPSSCNVKGGIPSSRRYLPTYLPRSVCVWSGFGFHPANPGSGVGVLVFVCALCLYPASAGCDVRCPRLCLGSTLGCAPPFLAEVLECVSLCARFTCTPRILAGGRGACVLVLVLAVTQPILARALGCVCLCARSACTPPLLAAVCGVGVCARV